MKWYDMAHLRDVLWLVLGTTILANEVFVRTGAERPYIIAIAGALLGVPAVILQDRKRRENGGDRKPD